MKHRLLFTVLCLFLSLWGQSVYAQKKPVIVKYTGFTIQYNPNNRQPDWAEYTLTAEHVEMSNNTPKVSRYFMPDPNLSLPQATPADYSKSGWVRGHMARRQDMKWSEQAIKECDYFTNICPQNDVMNNGVWHQIENLVRRMSTLYDSVHVICGPIFTDHSNGYIGPNRLPVPDYFFKTLLVKDGNGYHAIAFLCPNIAEVESRANSLALPRCSNVNEGNSDKDISMKDAACTVDKVESMSKIDVYSYLPDKIESLIESLINLKKWGLH